MVAYSIVICNIYVCFVDKIEVNKIKEYPGMGVNNKKIRLLSHKDGSFFFKCLAPPRGAL